MCIRDRIPVDPATGEVAGDKIETQAEQSCKNVGAILEEAGLTFDNVVKTTCFLADMADFAAFNAVYEKYFTSKPARSCVAVKQLPKNVLCEVEMCIRDRKNTEQKKCLKYRKIRSFCWMLCDLVCRKGNIRRGKTTE